MKLALVLISIVMGVDQHIEVPPDDSDHNYPRNPPSPWNSWHEPTPEPIYRVAPSPWNSWNEPTPSYLSPTPYFPTWSQPTNAFRCPQVYGTLSWALSDRVCGKHHRKCPSDYRCVSGHCCPIIPWLPPVDPVYSSSSDYPHEQVAEDSAYANSVQG
jgi:hypothetical protein